MDCRTQPASAGCRLIRSRHISADCRTQQNVCSPRHLRGGAELRLRGRQRFDGRTDELAEARHIH
eukprot:3667142-Lingulodinium_polyedra.AAC.1